MNELLDFGGGAEATDPFRRQRIGPRLCSENHAKDHATGSIVATDLGIDSESGRSIGRVTEKQVTDQWECVWNMTGEPELLPSFRVGQ